MHLLLQSAQNRIIVLFIAAAVDLLIGDPHGLWHPVQGDRIADQRFRKIFAQPLCGTAAAGRRCRRGS